MPGSITSSTIASYSVEPAIQRASSPLPGDVGRPSPPREGRAGSGRHLQLVLDDKNSHLQRLGRIVPALDESQMRAVRRSSCVDERPIREPREQATSSGPAPLNHRRHRVRSRDHGREVSRHDRAGRRRRRRRRRRDRLLQWRRRASVDAEEAGRAWARVQAGDPGRGRHPAGGDQAGADHRGAARERVLRAAGRLHRPARAPGRVHLRARRHQARRRALGGLQALPAQRAGRLGDAALRGPLRRAVRAAARRRAHQRRRARRALPGRGARPRRHQLRDGGGALGLPPAHSGDAPRGGAAHRAGSTTPRSRRSSTAS